jgi:phage N-6-adenine-methyltransferase
MSAAIGNRDPEKQGHRTPQEFLDAVNRRFGTITWDLAATTGHQVTGADGRHFSPEQDALAQDWRSLIHPEEDDRNCRVAWLNPPFSNIRPWVSKLDTECRELPRWTLCLVPASMGSHWWADHVLGKCVALGVTRMTFVGSTAPYLKDLALLCYGFGVSGHGFWDWRK